MPTTLMKSFLNKNAMLELILKCYNSSSHDSRITTITNLAVRSEVTIDCSSTIQECISIVCDASINNLHVQHQNTPYYCLNCLNTLYSIPLLSIT